MDVNTKIHLKLKFLFYLDSILAYKAGDYCILWCTNKCWNNLFTGFNSTNKRFLAPITYIGMNLDLCYPMYVKLEVIQ